MVVDCLSDLLDELKIVPIPKSLQVSPYCRFSMAAGFFIEMQKVFKCHRAIFIIIILFHSLLNARVVDAANVLRRTFDKFY
jgi:hypothetical protein